jgi:aryl-alcohol dehydrogenase-like predicted oxidoreductase
MQLCLGTVQFGLDYGIINQKKPSLAYCVNCLDYATQNGVFAIDTAAAYGNAEEIVGFFLQRKTIDRDKLFISSKMQPNVLDDCHPEKLYSIIREHLINQLRILHTDYLDAYILHSARYAHRADILEALVKVKKEGLAHKTGVSVYDPKEAFTCIESPFVDFMQLPYSLFDQRMRVSGVLKGAQNHEVQIHSRSAFIQGLILLKEDQVPSFLSDAKPIIKRIDKICVDTGLSRVALAMAFVKHESAISHLVFGIDTIEQLKEDIEIFNAITLSASQIEDIGKEFQDIKTEIVMPSLWKR